MPLILSGDTGPSFVQAAAQPTGTVLQVQQTATSAVIQTTSTSFVTTGLGITITPRSTISKVYVTVQGGGAYMFSTAGNTLYATIYRNNATNLGDATYGLERLSTPGGSWQLTPHSMAVLDNPSSTSAVTYTVYYRSGNGSMVEFSNNDRGVVTITAMEIQG